jgi:hypothetical protein
VSILILLIIIIRAESDSHSTIVGFIIFFLEGVLRFTLTAFLHFISVSFLFLKVGFFFFKELLLASSFKYVLETTTVSELEVVE